MLITIVSFVLVLGVLIFIHEFGHYIMAKKAGIRVEEFALGWGPKLFSHKKGETLYSLRAIPIGGFCNMTGEFLPGEEDDMDEEEKEIYLKAKKEGKCFHQKSVWKRFLVIFMGPLMNFALAGLIFIIIFSIFGLPVDSSQSTVIGDVTPGKPAREAGLKPNDKILAVNGQKVDNWQEMAEIIHNTEEEVSLRLQRKNETKKLSVEPEFNDQIDAYVIGIYPKMIKKKVGVFKAVQLGFVQTGRVIYLTISGFIDMISRRSTEGLGGPIMIANIVGEAAQIGWSRLLNWMAIISINLGIINLFPVPALDGGRILFLMIEGVRGKPIDPEKESFVHFIGFVLLMILMVFILYKDIVRSIF